jgi:hypothetical protein
VEAAKDRYPDIEPKLETPDPEPEPDDDDGDGDEGTGTEQGDKEAALA